MKLVVFMLICSLFIAACGKEEAGKKETASDGKKVLRLLEMSELPSLDSSISTDGVSFRVFNNVMEGLYRLDKDNKPVEGMAESVQVSDDKKTYTFKLRDAKWSNGEPVMAKDFVFSWKRAVDPATKSEYAFILFGVKNGEKVNKGELPLDQLGVKAQDDRTLVVELENPIPYFLELMAFPTFFPLNEKFIKEKGKNYGLEVEHLIYNGPFVLSEWKHEESFTFKKNDGYWDKATVKLDEIQFKIVKDIAAGVNLYNTDEVDRANISAEFVDSYKGKQEYYSESEARQYFIRFNQKASDVMKNQKARMAMSLAFDKEAIASQILNNGSQATYGLVPKGFSKGPDGKDFRETVGDLNKMDLNKAKSLWEEAKKELGKSEVKIELMNYDDSDNKKIGEYLKGQLEKNLVGLTVDLKQMPYKQKLKLEETMQYEASLGRWGPDYPDPMTYLELFISSSSMNEMGYSNPKYDDLIAKSKSELLTDPAARYKAMQEADKILLEDAAILPVYQFGQSYLQKPYVKDIAKHMIGGDYSYKWADIKK
nr:peptide ABC transporter substrate-binding protein [Priestia taiwanensis]